MDEPKQQPRRILPARDTYARTGMTRAQVWREERAGRFPQRILLTPYRLGWYEDEVAQWIATRPRCSPAIQMPRSPGRLGKRGAAAKAAA
jgi:predicted DNA-binding transcriptional regulator AlpA